jgi:peroxiredoxin
MKHLFFALFFCGFLANAQKEMPRIELKSADNKTVNVSDDFAEPGKIYVFAFWATWCVPCLNELDAIHEKYGDWTKDLNFQVVAVSIDDARTQKRVKPLLNGRNWPYTVLLDTNQDLKRALSVANVPYTVVVKDKKIVYIHNGYSQGGEEELYTQLKAL